VQAGQAFGFEAIQPSTHRARANVLRLHRGPRRLPTEDHADHVLSTERRQAGILIDVVIAKDAVESLAVHWR
jgi:hypothetical protein